MSVIIPTQSKVFQNQFGELPEIAVTGIAIKPIYGVDIYSKAATIEVTLYQTINEKSERIKEAFINLTTEEYDNWASDLPYIENLILNKLELTRL